MGRRVKTGDIYTFPLPTGEYAFVRVFQGSAVAAFPR